jgi:hypothetical protein
MPPMIDYAVLCRAIEDWKAGHAPQIPAASYSAAVASEPAAESYDAGEAEVDAGDGDASGIDAGEEDAGDVGDYDAGDDQQQDRTIIYQMPEIVDEEG